MNIHEVRYSSSLQNALQQTLVCANRLSVCHTFTVRRFILLFFKHQTNKTTAKSVEQNTKFQNYEQQSLMFRTVLHIQTKPLRLQHSTCPT